MYIKNIQHQHKNTINLKVLFCIIYIAHRWARKFTIEYRCEWERNDALKHDRSSSARNGSIICCLLYNFMYLWCVHTHHRIKFCCICVYFSREFQLEGLLVNITFDSSHNSISTIVEHSFDSQISYWFILLSFCHIVDFCY